MSDNGVPGSRLEDHQPHRFFPQMQRLSIRSAGPPAQRACDRHLWRDGQLTALCLEIAADAGPVARFMAIGYGWKKRDIPASCVGLLDHAASAGEHINRFTLCSDRWRRRRPRHRAR